MFENRLRGVELGQKVSYIFIIIFLINLAFLILSAGKVISTYSLIFGVIVNLIFALLIYILPMKLYNEKHDEFLFIFIGILSIGLFTLLNVIAGILLFLAAYDLHKSNS